MRHISVAHVWGLLGLEDWLDHDKYVRTRLPQPRPVGPGSMRGHVQVPAVGLAEGWAAHPAGPRVPGGVQANDAGPTWQTHHPCTG